MEMTEEKSYHMTPEEFRLRGHEVIDWVADYMRSIEQYRVLSQVEPGEVAASLPESPPQQGEPFEAALREETRLFSALVRNKRPGTRSPDA